MWSLFHKDYGFIEAGPGYIYFDSLNNKNLFEIAVISYLVRAPLCEDISKLFRLKKPVVFYGRSKIKEDHVYFMDTSISDRLVNYLRVNYSPKPSSERFENYVKKISFSFREAHPNVSDSGYLCPGTLGRYDPGWSPLLAANYLVRLVSMLSVPSFDSSLEGYGCKSYRILKKFLPTKLRSCLRLKCRRLLL